MPKFENKLTILIHVAKKTRDLAYGLSFVRIYENGTDGITYIELVTRNMRSLTVLFSLLEANIVIES